MEFRWKSLVSENRRTAALALPIISGHVGQMLMGWVDTVMVGWLGVVPLAACGFANTLISVPLVFGFGLLSAVSIHASHAHGAGEPERSAASVRGGFGALALLALVVAGFVGFVLPRLGIFGQPPEVASAAREFLEVCSWSLVPAFATTVAKNFCEAHGRPWPPFWIILCGVVLNAALNWALIFGHWGAPTMGLVGAAWATLVARTAVMVAVIAYASASRRLRGAWPAKWLVPGILRATGAILSVGLPTGGMVVFEVGGFAAGSIMMGWLGASALAAHQIAMTCAGTAFMVPLGLSQAVAVRVGHARGAERFARIRPIVYGAHILTILFMGTTFAAFVFAGKSIAGWFVSDPEVVRLAAQLLFVAGVFQIMDGVQVVAAGTLRGFADTRGPMWIGIFSYWVVALPVSWTAAFALGGGAVGIWAGYVVGLSVAAATLFARVYRRVSRLPVGGHPALVGT
jgi:MATE family multidrug resistance protein